MVDTKANALDQLPARAIGEDFALRLEEIPKVGMVFADQADPKGRSLKQAHVGGMALGHARMHIHGADVTLQGVKHRLTVDGGPQGLAQWRAGGEAPLQIGEGAHQPGVAASEFAQGGQQAGGGGSAEQDDGHSRSTEVAQQMQPPRVVAGARHDGAHETGPPQATGQGRQGQRQGRRGGGVIVEGGARAPRLCPGHEVGAAAEHQVVVGEGVCRRRWQGGAEVGHQQRPAGTITQQRDGLLIEKGRIFEQHHIGLLRMHHRLHIGPGGGELGWRRRRRGWMQLAHGCGGRDEGGASHAEVAERLLVAPRPPQ